MIVRADHHEDYTVIENTALRDNRLSFAARGLLAYMLSMKDDWQFYGSEVSRRNAINVKRFASLLKELIDNGYCKREKVRGKNGRFVYDYRVYEIPPCME